VRHVADGHATVIHEPDQAVDFELRDLVAWRAERKLGRDIHLAIAQIGDRPLPAAGYSSGQ
jgi:hypothetical protein